jgi:predicted nucleic acid-binding protein
VILVDASVLMYAAGAAHPSKTPSLSLLERIAAGAVDTAIDSADVLDRARAMLDEHETLGARDALHAAVVLNHGLEALCSYDRGFDRIEDVRRVTPEDIR